MNPFAAAFVVVVSAALLWVPRKWAPLPFLIGVCYMTMGQVLVIGGLHFTVVRILIGVGLCRALIRGERLTGRLNVLDRLMIGFAVWAVGSGLFHDDVASAVTYRAGFVYTVGGVYFLLRIFCQTVADVYRLCRLTVVMLVPLAGEMVFEVAAKWNVFSLLGGVPDTPAIREGLTRAQGPFAHSILAGTVGAVSLPMMIGLWHRHRTEAWAGVAACLTMVAASGSTGPVLSVAAGVAALAAWRWRGWMRGLRWTLVVGYIALDIAMKAPAYYLMARIDLTGGSTGWHRARLVEVAIERLNEWWFAGTDYTRHWMPTGVAWSEAHTDLVNQYIYFGVMGGVVLTALFVAIIASGFAIVGRAVASPAESMVRSRFAIWTLGAALCAHAVTFFSVSYHDQSCVFFYLTLAAIGAIGASTPSGRAVRRHGFDAVAGTHGARPRTAGDGGGNPWIGRPREAGGGVARQVAMDGDRARRSGVVTPHAPPASPARNSAWSGARRDAAPEPAGGSVSVRPRPAPPGCAETA